MVLSKVIPEASKSHLHDQYYAWSRLFYPSGRRSEPARLEILEGCGDAGYSERAHCIRIYIPDGDIDGMEHRFGKILIIPDKWRLVVSEIELLHEMIHEMQYKEITEVSETGRELYAKHIGRFFGTGHDEVFFTAVVKAAEALEISPEDLVENL